MSRKFKVWLDSGANAHSCRKQVISLDDMGLTDAQWDAMTEADREDVMRDVAFDHSDWGFTEVTDK